MPLGGGQHGFVGQLSKYRAVKAISQMDLNTSYTSQA